MRIRFLLPATVRATHRRDVVQSWWVGLRQLGAWIPSSDRHNRPAGHPADRWQFLRPNPQSSGPRRCGPVAAGHRRDACATATGWLCRKTAWIGRATRSIGRSQSPCQLSFASGCGRSGIVGMLKTPHRPPASAVRRRFPRSRAVRRAPCWSAGVARGIPGGFVLPIRGRRPGRAWGGGRPWRELLGAV